MQIRFLLALPAVLGADLLALLPGKGALSDDADLHASVHDWLDTTNVVVVKPSKKSFSSKVLADFMGSLRDLQRILATNLEGPMDTPIESSSNVFTNMEGLMDTRMVLQCGMRARGSDRQQRR